MCKRTGKGQICQLHGAVFCYKFKFQAPRAKRVIDKFAGLLYVKDALFVKFDPPADKRTTDDLLSSIYFSFRVRLPLVRACI